MPRSQKKTSPPPFDKRVVLKFTVGPLAGLHQIVGTVSQLREERGALPDFVSDVTMPDGRSTCAGLVSFKTRHVLYKEINGPAMHAPLKTFSPEQR